MHYIQYCLSVYGGGMVAQPNNVKDMEILSVMPQSAMHQIMLQRDSKLEVIRLDDKTLNLNLDMEILSVMPQSAMP